MPAPPRFLWVIQYFVGAGFYVIPTYSPADYSVDNTVASTPAVFLRNWANLWSAITEVWLAAMAVNATAGYFDQHTPPILGQKALPCAWHRCPCCTSLLVVTCGQSRMYVTLWEFSSVVCSRIWFVRLFA